MNGKYIGMRLTFFLASIFLVIYGLILAKEFLYPVAFGMLFSYLLYPIVNFFEKKGIPRILSILITLAIAIVIFGALAVFVLKRINLFMDELPEFRQKTVNHVESLQRFIESEYGFSARRLKTFLLDRIGDIGAQSGKIFSTTTGTIFVILIQPVYVFLFLFYRTKFAYFILKMVGKQNRTIAIGVLREIAKVVTRYMLGVTFVVLILCIFNSIGYLIIGIDYPLLLGVVSALFSFIPYFGNFMGATVPFVFALLTEDSTTYAVRVVIFACVVHFFENNILSPNIVGNQVRINPFIIILGLIMGAMIWGIPGMLVAIPFLAIVNTVLKKIPGMQAYVFLLGPRGTRKHGITFENTRKYFETIRIRWNRMKGRKNRNDD